MTATLHVFHTNDFHNALTETGAARLRAAVDALGSNAPHLLLDAGDAIKAGNVGVNPFGEPILGLMSRTGYHAMTLGNREFHVWRRALETKINRAAFPVLCANIRRRGEPPFGARWNDPAAPPLPVEPWRVFDVAPSLRVAVLGLTVPMVTERMKAAVISAFVFDDPIKTAAALVPRLREKADAVIALTHIGLREDERLGLGVPGVSLIVGGHSHVTLPTPKWVDSTPIVQTGVYGRHFGHVILTFSDDAHLLNARGELHLLEEKPRR